MTSLSETTKRLNELIPLIRERLSDGQSVTFSPKGTSMLPMLRQGIDTVEISSISGRLKKYDLPLYQRDNGQYVLHRIVEVGETYTCIGDNQFVLESGLRQDQMIAIVSAFTRGGKRIEVSNPKYQMYCRIWCASRLVRHVWFRIRHILYRGKSWLKRHIRRWLT